MVVIALLYGEGDFGKTLCLAVNCGEDTDCTAATAGSLLGIILGIDGIDEKWAKPVGTRLKTACLNLGELGNLGNQLPKDIFELQKRIEVLAPQVLSLHRAELFCPDHSWLYRGPDTARFRFPFFDIDVSYENGPSIIPGTEKRITFTVHNRYKTSENFLIRIYSCENSEWNVAPSSALVHVPEGIWFKNREQITFTFSFGRASDGQLTDISYRAVAEFSTPSRSGVMLVPLYFIHNPNAFTSNKGGNIPL